MQHIVDGATDRNVVTDIGLDQAKTLAALEVRDVVGRTRHEVIKACHVNAPCQQTFRKVRADEPRAPCYHRMSPAFKWDRHRGAIRLTCGITEVHITISPPPFAGRFNNGPPSPTAQLPTTGFCSLG